jgi:hypothetical protein
MMNIFSPELFFAGMLGENYAKLGYFGVIAVMVIGIAVTIVSGSATLRKQIRGKRVTKFLAVF